MPLSEEERKQRHKESTKRYYEKNKEKFKESGKEYREQNKEKRKESQRQYKEKNKEKIKEYYERPEVKKRQTITKWVNVLGLKESKEDLDRIYHLRQTQELCNACDCILTRDGDRSSTQACMDHDHETGRFRHIICNSCNSQDNWKKYFC